MGIHLKREKKRNRLLGLVYRLNKLTPLGSKRKLRLFLDLSWIFARLAHEETYVGNHRLPQKPGIDFLTGLVKDGQQVLDIGCGHGEIVELMLKKDCRVTGVDLNTDFIEALRKKVGNRAELVNDDVFHFLASRQGPPYDVIVLSNVLEHFDDPLGFLERIRGAATRLYIEVPDFETDHLNVYRQKAGTDLIYTDGDHINEFDRDGLAAIITKSGWKVLESQFRFGVIQYWCG